MFRLITDQCAAIRNSARVWTTQDAREKPSGVKKFGFGGGVLTPPAQRSERPMYAGPLGVRPDVPPASL